MPCVGSHAGQCTGCAGLQCLWTRLQDMLNSIGNHDDTIDIQEGVFLTELGIRFEFLRQGLHEY